MQSQTHKYLHWMHLTPRWNRNWNCKLVCHNQKVFSVHIHKN